MTNDSADPIYAPANETEAFRQAMWDVATEAAEFYYEHPDVRFPEGLARALDRLDNLPFNPLRPIPPDGLPEGGV